MLDLQNVRMEPSNVRNKIRELPNVTKELSYVMLELHDMRMKLSNLRKKVREPPMCGKKIITCDVEFA